jgi:hypothetical protein
VDDAARYFELRHLFVSQAVLIDATAAVPACPGWNVHDLFAHQVHQLSSATDGTFPVRDALDAIVGPKVDRRHAARTRQDRWTAAGVAARRGVPTVDLTAEWEALARDAPVAALAGLFPDLAVHFFDLLGSVGQTGYRDEPFVTAALRFWAHHSDTRLRQVGRGPLRLDVESGSGQGTSIGPGDAPLVAAATSFEVLRAIVGRRSHQQVDALRWDGADGVARACFPVYGCRADDLDE